MIHKETASALKELTIKKRERKQNEPGGTIAIIAHSQMDS